MKLNFVTVDVFTGTQFAGNPLGVVLNAQGLSGGQMQAIAAEFNLAETTFVLPPKNPAHTAEVRIFTPRYASPQLLTVGVEIPAELIASACSLSVDDIETSNHPPLIASCGAPFILAELKDRTRLAAAAARSDVFMREISKQPATSLLIYTQVAEAGLDIRARMFAPHHGIPEDPATGSANVALIGLLAKLRPDRDLRISKTIAQGVEMGRPSVLEAEAEKQNGTVTATYIGGRCMPVMSGTIELA